MALIQAELDQISSPPFEVPHNLSKKTLRKTQTQQEQPSDRWNDRGKAIEFRVKGIIESQTFMVREVKMNGDSNQGSDLTVVFVEDFPIKELLVEVKSSSMQLRRGKTNIRNQILAEKNITLQEWTDLPDEQKDFMISSRLTRDGVALINGGAKGEKERTPDEILRESLFPQVRRAILKAEGMTPEETVIAQKTEEIQIWPWIPPSSFTQLFP